MPAITNRTTLQASLASWSERSDYDFDEIVGQAEADFRLYLGPNYAKEESTTLTLVAGAVSLPAGYVRPLNLSHATYGALTLLPLSAIRQRRILANTGIPDSYAVTGTQILTAPTYDGDLTFDYEGTLPALDDSDPNWLIRTAPQAYLAMCKSYVKAWEEDMGGAATWRAAALGLLSDLSIQSMIGSSGGGVRIPGVTP